MSARLHTVTGDALVGSGLDVAVEGQDAVLSALGADLTERPTEIYSLGAERLMDALQRRDVPWFAVLSAAGAGRLAEEPHPPFVYRRAIRTLVLPRVYREMQDMERRIARRGLA